MVQRIFLSFALGFLLLSGTPASAEATGLVVFEAKGTSHNPGDIIDGTKPLSLNKGQSLSLITPDGKIMKLTGAYFGAPAQQGPKDKGGVIDALKGLVKKQDKDTKSLGVTRAAFPADGAAAQSETPWVLNASAAGDQCIRAHDPAVLWRASEARDAPVKFSTVDGSWSASTNWPAGYKKLAVPADAPLSDGGRFIIDLNGSANVITLHILPAGITDAKVLAAWMAQKRCVSQAKLLLNDG